MSERKLYKVLVDGKSCHGGDLAWSLPKDGQPGDWHEVDGDLRICERGLHLTDAPYGEWWKWRAAVYEAEADGIESWKGDKCVCRRARLLREAEEPFWLGSAVSFVESIKHVPWFQRVAPPDPSWRVFPTRAAARDAAWASAWAAAGAAAWASALDAAGAAARASALDAAGAAARDAAWAAAWASALDAAGAAARDAAWAAARDAAGAAALLARCLIVQDIIDPAHLDHALARWRVWEMGYGLTCDVNGTFYVYERP